MAGFAFSEPLGSRRRRGQRRDKYPLMVAAWRRVCGSRNDYATTPAGQYASGFGPRRAPGGAVESHGVSIARREARQTATPTAATAVSHTRFRQHRQERFDAAR